MQCASCQFENMPGTPSCVRCGASLNFAAVLSVAPPRAGARRKAIRRWLPLRQSYYPVHNSAVAIGQSMGTAISRSLRIHLPPALAIVRMILPGWAHAYLGHKERGWVFFCAWIIALAVGIVAFGSTAGAIALGLSFAVHAASVLDLLLQVNQTSPRSIMIAAALTIAVLATIYVPVGRAASGYVSSRRLIETAEPFASGDVVIFRPGAYATMLPQTGDVVLYRSTPFNAEAPRRAWRQAVYRIGGEWVDRVIAGPDSTVRFEDGILLVNGEPSPFMPLNPQNLPSLLLVQVPRDACCILPTTNPYLPGTQDGDTFASRCIVPRSQIVGKVILRNYPVWRWWWVR